MLQKINEPHEDTEPNTNETNGPLILSLERLALKLQGLADRLLKMLPGA